MSLVERLKVSKEQFESENYASGKQAGREYATKQADYGDMIRVSSYLFSLGRDWQSVVQKLTPLDVSEIVSGVENDEFWDFATYRDNSEVNESEYLRGFVEGVNEVYEEVKDQL